jgi:hypothetical protein
MRYFRIIWDTSIADRWFPGEPLTRDGREVDARTFTRCELYQGEPLVLPTVESGPRMPFSFGPFDMPVVDERLGDKLHPSLGDEVQLVSVAAEGEHAYILNALRCVDCIDEVRTIGEKWSEDAGRPDKIGEYRTVLTLFIDPERAGGAGLLRLQGWRSPLIVSDEVARLFDARDLVGIRLLAVT